MDFAKKREINQIRELLETLLDGKNHCPNCGGLIPELSLVMAGKQFHFVCHEIAEQEKFSWEGDKEKHTPRKVLATTDYKKLVEYLKKRTGG